LAFLKPANLAQFLPRCKHSFKVCLHHGKNIAKLGGFWRTYFFVYLKPASQHNFCRSCEHNGKNHAKLAGFKMQSIFKALPQSNITGKNNKG
jgi:hypothetical protein